MNFMRRSRHGFILAYIALFLGAVSVWMFARSDRQLAAASFARRQALAAQARAMAEGAVADARARLERADAPLAGQFDSIEFPDGSARCSFGEVEPDGRVRLEAIASVGQPVFRVSVTVGLRLEGTGSTRRSIVESWEEKLLR